MPILSVTTELWFAWSEIAAEQQIGAAGWRRTAEADIAAGRNPANAMAQENKASLAAMAAAGAALETLGTYLASYDKVASRKEEAWERFVRQALHLYPDAEITTDLQQRIRMVFRRRNQTLHYASRAETMGPHPIGLQSTWVARTFTVEGAAAVVDAVADTLTAVFTPGTSPIQRAEWEAMRCRSVGAALRGRSKLPVDIVP